MPELEQEFQATIDQVNAKLQEAAKALREANDLAIKAGYKNGLINSQWAREAEMEKFPDEEGSDEDEDPYDIIQAKYDLLDISDLEEAMSDAGWQPSSSYC